MNHSIQPVARRAGKRLGVLVFVLVGLAGLADGAGAAGRSPSTLGVVNINTANSEELQLLPGVGPVRAQAILAQRKDQGGYTRIEDLARVRGIGDSMLEKLRPHVILVGRTTARLSRERSPHAFGRGG